MVPLMAPAMVLVPTRLNSPLCLTPSLQPCQSHLLCHLYAQVVNAIMQALFEGFSKDDFSRTQLFLSRPESFRSMLLLYTLPSPSTSSSLASSMDLPSPFTT